MKNLALALLIVSIWSGSLALADKQQSNNQQIDMKKDFSTLGDNDAVIERAKALDPKNKYKVVQSRSIDRNLRLEVGGNIGTFSGGDPYYNSVNYGLNLDFHINPSFSIGGRYYHSSNSLSAEGKDLYQNAAANNANGQHYTVPGSDYANDTTLGTLTWYPIYGKLAALGVTHFDIYFLGGYGVTSLDSGPAATIAAGGGMAFWFSQHFNARLEARYQEYNDHPYSDTPQAYTRQVNEVVYMASIGFML